MCVVCGKSVCLSVCGVSGMSASVCVGDVCGVYGMWYVCVSVCGVSFVYMFLSVVCLVCVCSYVISVWYGVCR